MQMKKWKDTVTVSENAQTAEDRTGRILLGVAVILGALYLFFYRHYDCEAITSWGYDLLECVRRGNLSGFPEYTYASFGSPTNYTLFVNSVTALWLTPLYLLDQAAGLDLTIFFYEKWYKLLVGIALLLDLWAMDRLFAALGAERTERRRSQALFLLSAVMLLATLGKGQVDVYGLFFVLLGARFLVRKEDGRGALLLGMALLVKPTALLVLVPLFLLLIGRWKEKTVVLGLIAAAPYLLDKGVTALLMPDYLPLSQKTFPLLAEALGGLTITEQFFDLEVNQVLVFAALALVLCFACYYLGVHGKTRREHLLALPPLLLICFGIFVCASFHWFIYLLPALLLMGLKLERRSDFYLLWLGMSLGLTVYFASAESMTAQPLAGLLFGGAGEGAVIQYTGDYQEYVLACGKTLFYVCMLLIPGGFLWEQRQRRGEARGEAVRKPDVAESAPEDVAASAPEDEDERKYAAILLAAQPLWAIVYLIISWVVYCNG